MTQEFMAFNTSFVGENNSGFFGICSRRDNGRCVGDSNAVWMRREGRRWMCYCEDCKQKLSQLYHKKRLL